MAGSQQSVSAIEDEPLARAAGVTLAFGGKSVLEDVDLNLRASEIVTLIGPNGSGKTTLVRVLLGLQRPDRGEVQIKAGITLGYLPQRLTLDPVLPLSVRRFLCLPKPHGPRALAAALDEVGAPALLERRVEDLSGGEFQRMLLARALLRDPDLLILDEPFQGVDFAGQLTLFRLIETLRAGRGCAILLVSHDLHLVMAGTNRVVCLNKHVCCSGQPEAVSRHPDYLALFGPRAAEGLAVYSHAHDHHHGLSGEVVPHTSDAPGTAARSPVDASKR